MNKLFKNDLKLTKFVQKLFKNNKKHEILSEIDMK